MAHIKKLTDKPRTLPWRAQVHRKGHKLMVKMFAKREEAEHWAGEQERNIRISGLPLTIDDLKRHTVADIVSRYIEEVTPTKGCRVSETLVLKRLLKRDIAKKSLAYLKKQDAWDYVKVRLQDTWRGNPITPRTVRREVNSIQHVFQVAKEQWGFENLNNPFRGLPIKGSMYRRKRRLHDGELEKLLEACTSCRGFNRYYVPLAILLAIETGMRLQEIFNLEWEDIDFRKRKIEIRKSKTDYRSAYDGRTIVLSKGAQLQLLILLTSLSEFKAIPGPERMPAPFTEIKGRIFPMRKEAFKQSWADVCKRARISDLTFHDLRREAGSRFDEADLSAPQRELMLGHFNQSVSAGYVNAHLKIIRDKLDLYQFGRTEESAKAELIAQGGLLPKDIVSVRAFAVACERGLSNAARDTRIANAIRRWNMEMTKYPNADIEFLRKKAKAFAV